jgi:hypothetical protein
MTQEIESLLQENGWDHYSKKPFNDESICIIIRSTVTKVDLTCTIVVSDLALRILVHLPVVFSPEFIPLVDEYIVNANFALRYGAWGRDASDNEVRFKLAYSVGEEFDKEAFKGYLLFSLFKAADAYPEMVRLSVGKLSRDKLEKAIEKYTALLNALNA